MPMPLTIRVRVPARLAAFLRWKSKDTGHSVSLILRDTISAMMEREPDWERYAGRVGAEPDHNVPTS